MKKQPVLAWGDENVSENMVIIPQGFIPLSRERCKVG